MQTGRRQLLKTGLGFGAGAGLMGALPGAATAARAASGDYKAIVCIYLDGGVDCHDLFIPTAHDTYGRYAEVRRAVLDAYEANGDDSRAQSRLIGLENEGQATGYGVPSHLAPLAALYRRGVLGIVANVGPLVERADRAGVADGRMQVIPRLGSHNDQQSLWQTSALESASDGFGWGGLMTEAVSADSSPFSGISFSHDARFAAGRLQPAYRMGTGRVKQASATNGHPFGSRDAADYLSEHLRASAARMNNYFATDFQNAQRSALDAADALADMISNTTVGDSMRRNENPLLEQLSVAAKMISLRGQLGIKRQVFHLNLSGFDTHGDLGRDLTKLETVLAEAMTVFYEELVRQGLERDVLTFTASDFGRTLVPNKAGTDHGWGGHHFVMGGGIRGGRIYGEMPEPGVGHDQDMGRGRLIPTTSVDQYAGGIGSWFGVGESDLAAILPGHRKHGDPLAF